MVVVFVGDDDDDGYHSRSSPIFFPFFFSFYFFSIGSVHRLLDSDSMLIFERLLCSSFDFYSSSHLIRHTSRLKLTSSSVKHIDLVQIVSANNHTTPHKQPSRLVDVQLAASPTVSPSVSQSICYLLGIDSTEPYIFIIITALV